MASRDYTQSPFQIDPIFVCGAHTENVCRSKYGDLHECMQDMVEKMLQSYMLART